MSKTALSVRVTLLAGLLGLLSAAFYTLIWGTSDASTPLPSLRIPSRDGEITVERPEDCRPCHAREYEEWARSRHAMAWTNPQLHAFAELTLGIADCVKCHAPRPVFITGLGDLPRARPGKRETGVDCLTCHLTEKGIVGAKGNPDAPCRPMADSSLKSSAVCSGCHRTIGLDWSETGLPGEDVHCVDCHMAKRGHDPAGGHVTEKLREAFAFDVRITGGEVSVSVKNERAGHNFPGERHFRILQIHVEVIDEGGETLEEYARVIKNVSAIRTARRDAKIMRGEEVRYDFPLPSGHGKVRAVLFYKLYPSVSDVDALLLAGKEVPY